MRYWSPRIIWADPKGDEGNLSQSRWRSPTHSFSNSCIPRRSRERPLSAICVDARAELNLSKRLSAWSDSKGSLWRRPLAPQCAPLVLFQIKFQHCFCAAPSFVLFGYRSTHSVSFLKYKGLCSRLQKHLERLKFATCSGACSGRSFLLHLNGKLRRRTVKSHSALQRCERRMEKEITFFVSEIIAANFCPCADENCVFALCTHLCLF